MPLELEFVGNFFNLADFFHDIKRFVRVANKNVLVSGRLVTIEGVKFASDPELFPRITAEVEGHHLPLAEGAGHDGRRDASGPARSRARHDPGERLDRRSTPSPAPTATATP